MDSSTVRVLLVDDNPADARLVEEKVREARGVEFRFERVGRLGTALERLARESFDVVLLDLALPDAFGLDAVRALQLQAPHVPLVVLTALDDEVLATRAVEQGAEDYLIKGQLSVALLPRSLKYAIERHRLRTALLSLSLVDELTGQHNRRGFQRMGEKRLQLARRLHKGLTLLALDLDRFRERVDLYGHQAADAALVSAAEVMTATFRSVDILGRLHGERFVVLGLDDAPDGPDLMRGRLAENLAKKDARLSFTTGVGRAAAGSDVTLEGLLSEADAAVHHARRAERPERQDQLASGEAGQAGADVP